LRSKVPTARDGQATGLFFYFPILSWNR
jgi:hypothetical protein